MLWAAQSGIIEPDMGFSPLLKAFVAAIVGGFGSVAGAVLGGYLLGALEILIVGFGPPELSPYRDAVVYGLLIVFLLFRPGCPCRTILSAISSASPHGVKATVPRSASLSMVARPAFRFRPK